MLLKLFCLETTYLFHFSKLSKKDKMNHDLIDYYVSSDGIEVLLSKKMKINIKILKYMKIVYMKNTKNF